MSALIDFFGGGATGFWSYLGLGYQFGQSWSETFWISGWVVWIVFAAAVMGVWGLDAGEEDVKTAGKITAVVIGVHSLACIGGIVHIYSGYIVPYILLFGLVYGFRHKEAKHLFYAGVAGVIAFMIAAWILPGIFGDWFGWANWRNWFMWCGADIEGPGLYGWDEMWGARSGQVAESVEDVIRSGTGAVG